MNTSTLTVVRIMDDRKACLKALCRIEVLMLVGVYIQWNLDTAFWDQLLTMANITLPQFLIEEDRYWLSACF